eukprot:2483572-Prymnesium_polylepis.1
MQRRPVARGPQPPEDLRLFVPRGALFGERVVDAAFDELERRSSVRPVGRQVLDDAELAFAARFQQRRAVLVTVIEFGARLHQNPHARQVAVQAGDEERRRPLRVALVHRSAVFEQQPHAQLMPILAGNIERRDAVRINLVWYRAFVEQQLDDLAVALLAGHVERRRIVVRRIAAVDARAVR